MAKVGSRLLNDLEISIFDTERLKDSRKPGTYNNTHIPFKGRYRINGIKRSPFYHPKSNYVRGHYATTEVPDAVWGQWLKENKNNSLLMGKVIFEVKDDDEAKGVAVEMKAEETGLNPMTSESLAQALREQVEKREF